MLEEAKGRTLVETSRTVTTDQIEELKRVIDSPTAAETAALMTFFGPTVTRGDEVVEGMGIDFSRALLGGMTVEWVRPFNEGEVVDVKVTFADLVQKTRSQVGTVVAEYRDQEGDLVQRQTITFVERGEG